MDDQFRGVEANQKEDLGWVSEKMRMILHIRPINIILQWFKKTNVCVFITIQRGLELQEEDFEGGVKPGWISVVNRRGESIPDLWANDTYRPAIQCRTSGRWFDEGALGCWSGPPPTL